MEAALLAVLILLNGVFALSEISVISARGALLRADAARGRGAAAALRLKEDSTAFLSTVQVGITCIGILNGIVGEAARAPPLARWLENLGVGGDAAGRLATGLVVVTITYATIVFGELVPKRVGQIHAESVARRVARPMEWVAAIARPFVRLLTASTRLVLGALGVRDERMRSVTEEEIQAQLAEGSEAGVIEAHERDMVRNVFRLDDRQIGSLMVPRRDVAFLDPALPWGRTLGALKVPSTRAIQWRAAACAIWSA